MTKVYIAGAVIDALFVHCSPGALAVRNGRILASGDVKQVLDTAGPGAERIDLPDRLLIPGLVNAHAHLDLSSLSPRPYGGDFIAWLKVVIDERLEDSAEIERSVRFGAQLSFAAGVMTVGDIAGTPEASAELFRLKLRGVSFVELFGLGGEALEHSMERLETMQKVGRNAARQSTSLQPHAPYSAGPALFRAAAWVSDELGSPVSTHLAETREELEFVSRATGPFRQMLQSIGRWKEDYEPFYNAGLHPVDWLERCTHTRAEETPTIADPQAAWILAHCNYMGDAHIQKLAERKWSVAYCPRASDYFGHRGHRYRDMIAAGVNVCLGTDSILCHGSLSILDEMRHLYQRDGTDPALLLKMATVNGMKALRLDEREATFTPGAAPGIVALRYDSQPGTNPLQNVLHRDSVEMDVLEHAG